MINAIKFSIEEIEASDQYFDHTGADRQGSRITSPMILGNMRANGVRKLGVILDPARDARQGGTVRRLLPPMRIVLSRTRRI